MALGEEEAEPASKPLRIVFFGLPLCALLLARDGHDVTLCALSRTDSVGLRRARRTFGDRLLIKPSVRDPALLARVRALKPDLLVSWFWTTRLPMTIVRAARLGGIGAHPSLLPRHRGPDPTYWAITSGDEETGVTVHRIEAEYDTGEMLAQERLRIDPAWNAWLLARALDRPSLRLLRATVARFARGEDVPGLPQDPALATQAPAPDDEACAIRWDRSTAEILRQVRALAPAPGAWTEVEGALVTVIRAVAADRYPRVLAPGEGAVDGDRVIVRTGDGAIALLQAEIDGAPAGPAELSALFLSRAPLVIG
ncbi:Methionyl-tRNA formyltransferase [Minicystis rosea]|nr:Methionyl-tRNA formyltransferase [Minicystis rosea]